MNYDSLLSQLATLHQESLGRAVSAVNQALVLRNWAMGAYIVEFEQKGEARAAYAAKLLTRLSKDLAERGLSGVSRPELIRCRLFFHLYPQLDGRIRSSLPNILLNNLEESSLEICSPVASKSSPTPLSSATILQLSWTHLCEFIKLDDPWKRAFYENECLKGKWSDSGQDGTSSEPQRGCPPPARGCAEERGATPGDATRHPQTPTGFRLCSLTRKKNRTRRNPVGIGNQSPDTRGRRCANPGLEAAIPLGLNIKPHQNRAEIMMKQTSAASIPLHRLCALGVLDQQLFVSRYLVALPKQEVLQHLLENDREQLSQDSGDQT